MIHPDLAFIPTDFWQPDRDQWKSWATLGALGLALINVGLMRVIWVQAFNFKDATYRRLSLVHRTFGYTAFGVMLFIAIVTCIGIIGYGGYETRPTWHSYVGMTVLGMMGIKIIAVRKGLPEGDEFRRWAIGLSLIATIALAIWAGASSDRGTAFVLPLFPLAVLLGFVVWKRFGSLPVVGSGLLLSVSLLFVSSAGWWFVDNATADDIDVSAVMDLPVDIELGAQVFRTAGCTGCHGDRGEGGIGPSLRDARFAYSNTRETIAQKVRSGPGIMPAFGPDQIDDRQLAGLIGFIQNWYDN